MAIFEVKIESKFNLVFFKSEFHALIIYFLKPEFLKIWSFLKSEWNFFFNRSFQNLIFKGTRIYPLNNIFKTIYGSWGVNKIFKDGISRLELAWK